MAKPPRREPLPPTRRPKPGDGFAWHVVQRVDQALFVVDAHWRLVWANDAAARFFQLSLDRCHGETVWSLFPDSRDTEIETRYRAARDSGEPQRFEVYFPPQDRWFHVRVTPLEGELLIAYNDITRRKRAEQQGLQRERVLREITEHVSDVITRNVVGGPLTWVSPSMTTVLGWELADFEGRLLRDIVHVDDQPLVVEALTQAVEHDKPVAIEVRTHHKAGGLRHLQVRGRVLRSGAGAAGAELVLSSRDITAQVEARAALERALAAAEAATRAKSAFLANMSHEIRTPLHGVIGMTSVLRDTPLTEQQRESVNVIRSSGEALLAVINDILDLSKIEAGAMRLAPEEVDLRRCLEEALDLVTAPAASKNLELAYQVEPDVPSHVLVDAARLRQVLANLLSNAVKFTDAGEVVLRVQVAASGQTAGGAAAPSAQHSARPVTLEVTVQDSGLGIPSDRQAELFAPFAQLDDSSTRRHGGTGLGLSIARRLVELMGGEISVHSTLGQGSTFRFSLPVQPVATRGRARLSAPPGCLDNLRVLIVDDNAVNRPILLRLCESWNMDPVSFAGALEAMDWLERGAACDLAILDMQMPGIDGAQLARAIRSQRPALPLMVLSSMGHDVPVPEAFLRLSKPVKHTRLYEALVAQFSARRSGVNVPVVLDPEPAAPKREIWVLLAEDNEVNQLVGRLMLSRAGVRVDVVGDGRQALAALKRRRYDVVLMDVQMPELDGIEATRQIRAGDGPQPWIIALTASALDDDRRRCLAAGMDDHLGKPLRREDLMQALARAGRVDGPA